MEPMVGGDENLADRAVSQPPAFRLSLHEAVGQSLRHGRENPICHRVWRKLSPWALLCFIVQAILVGFSLASQTMQSTSGAMAGLNLSASFLVTYVGMCGFSILVFAIWIAAPILYTRWAWRLTWEDDELLRLTTMSRLDRLMGMVVPLQMAVVLFFLPTILMTPVIMYFSWESTIQVGMPMVGDSYSRLIALGAAFTQGLLSCWMNLLLYPTVVTRFLLLDKRTGVDNGRGVFSVVLAYLVQWGLSVVWGIVRSIPLMVIIFLNAFSMPTVTGPGPVTPGMAMTRAARNISPEMESGFAAIYVVMIVIDIIAIPLMFMAMRYLWKQDWPLAQKHLFDAEGGNLE